MNISNIMLSARNADSFSTIVQMSSVKTQEDIDAAAEKDIAVGITVDEFIKKYPGVDPERIYIGNALSGSYYWEPETMVIFPIQLINGEYLALGKTTFQEHIQKAKAAILGHIKENDYRFIATSLNDRMRMEYLKMLIDRDVPNIYELFTIIYPLSDYGCSSLGQDGIDKLLSRKTDAQKAATAAFAQTLPPIVTVYRGCGSESSALSESYSWTLNSAVALFFATRLTKEGSRLYTAKVKREDIFEYIDGTEDECLILPEKIFDLNIREFYDFDWLKDETENVGALYRDYRDNARYDKMPFDSGSEIHEKSHSLRVLLFCLFIAQLNLLDEEDVDILAEAALYHDTGRYHDGEDRRHGTLSAKKYKKLRKNPDPIVIFLMKYHCKPDEEGLAFIDSDPILSAQKERVTLLFNIFKDADGLDRVRLGPYELDFTQLRTEEAKQLPLIARLTHDHMKFD